MPDSEYRLVPLRDRHGNVKAHAKVDAVDFERVSAHRWSLVPDGYARGGRPTQQLHRFILGCRTNDGLIVDHINRDRLDNRRANLRIADPALNSRNQERKDPGRSQYRGVHPTASGRWRAIAGSNEYRHIGTYATEIEAAAAAAQYRFNNWPGVDEDPRLLALSPKPLKQAGLARQLTTQQALQVWLTRMSTTLSHAAIAELMNVGTPVVASVLSGRSYKEVHSLARAHTG